MRAPCGVLQEGLGRWCQAGKKGAARLGEVVPGRKGGARLRKVVPGWEERGCQLMPREGGWVVQGRRGWWGSSLSGLLWNKFFLPWFSSALAASCHELSILLDVLGCNVYSKKGNFGCLSPCHVEGRERGGDEKSREAAGVLGAVREEAGRPGSGRQTEIDSN